LCDNMVLYDKPLYERLRTIKELVELGADPNYVDSDDRTALEQAFLGEQILHIKLLTHLGAEMTTREINAMNTSVGIRNIGCLLRICPNLRKYYLHKVWNEGTEDSNSSFMNSVDHWIHHEHFQLFHDPEILSILFDQANVDITPYLQKFHYILPPVCLLSLQSRFGQNLYIRIWMCGKPYMHHISWKTCQCTIGVYSQPDRMANSLLQIASSSEHCYNNESAMYDATAKVIYLQSKKESHIPKNVYTKIIQLPQ
ncbi:MAG: hypothetical protein WD512_20500, partial [Candidatus Paceibacterota bacterium]